MSPWEITAVVLAIAYLLLAVRQNIWCWACAAVSTAIYLVLMYQAKLYSESGLQVFYIAMAVYGWYQWRFYPGAQDRLRVSTWSMLTHVIVIAVTGAAALTLGSLVGSTTDAALPYLDAFTTCFAVVATYMVTRKVLENWYYWFVIDAVSIYLYLQRDLHLTAGLFALYLVIIVFGFRAWQMDYRREPAIRHSATATA